VREFAVDDHDPDILEDESPDTDGMTAYESSSDDDADAHTMTPEDMQESRVFGISTTFSRRRTVIHLREDEPYSPSLTPS
jgi:hypothetical protein